ncbi:MAG: hypothetical protein Ct9H300mP1_34580 [Planctomycetaceae bacterium]|nr:MAG: hypothetical protein Ct9H300mP1_34580 [Planctomycetaceae bacterium]
MILNAVVGAWLRSSATCLWVPGAPGSFSDPRRFCIGGSFPRLFLQAPWENTGKNRNRIWRRGSQIGWWCGRPGVQGPDWAKDDNWE